MKKRLKTIIIDDNDIFRDGLRFFIDNKTDWDVVQEVSSGVDFLKSSYAECADIILIDINMPVLNGVETIVQFFIQNFPSRTKVLAITAHLGNFQLQKLIEAGFSGYLLKKDIYKYLKEAVAQVVEGSVYFHKYINENNFKS